MDIEDPGRLNSEPNMVVLVDNLLAHKVLRSMLRATLQLF